MQFGQPEHTSGSVGSAAPLPRSRLREFSDDPIACMRKLQAEQGHVAVLEEGHQRLVFVFGPHYNQQVLTDTDSFHSCFFLIRGPRNSAQRRLTCGLLSMNGDRHRQQRRMVMDPFQKRSFVHYHEPLCRVTTDLLNGWQPGESINLHTEMTRHMLQVTSGLLFGFDVPEMAYRVAESLHRWTELNHQLGMWAFIADPEYSQNYDVLLRQADELEGEIRQMIEYRRSSGRYGNDVLSILLRVLAEGGELTEEELIGHTALLFGAAHMTTAHTFTWTLFLLAQHPSIMREVLGEIQSTMPGSAPTLDEIGRMALMERVVKASMLILPASAYSQRVTARPVQLGPLHLPRGTPVVFSQFMTHRLPDLFPEPDRFWPDRWLTAAPSPYAYLPFGAGPRMCLGGPLAMVILRTALPMILKRFRLSLVPHSAVNGKVISTMLMPVESVAMHVAEQDGQFQAQPVTGNIHSLVDLHEIPTAARRAA